MAPRVFNNAGAQSTCASPITAAQTTITLVSASGFAAIPAGSITEITILDSGNPSFNPANPLATPYEYQPITAISGNVLTINSSTRAAYAGTTPHAFFTGATIASGLLAGALAPNTGAFARIDKVAGGLQLGGLAAANGPPAAGTWAAGDEYDDLAGSKWICITAGTPGTWRRADGWFGFGTPRQGSGGTINNRILTQTDSAVVTTNASGDATITFPVGFPTGWFTVLPTLGDVSVGGSVVLNPASQSATVFSVRVYAAYPTAYVGACRINYLAIGW